MRQGQNSARDLWVRRAGTDEFNCTGFTVFLKLMMKGSQLPKRRLLLSMPPPVNSAHITFI